MRVPDTFMHNGVRVLSPRRGTDWVQTGIHGTAPGLLWASAKHEADVCAFLRRDVALWACHAVIVYFRHGKAASQRRLRSVCYDFGVCDFTLLEVMGGTGYLRVSPLDVETTRFMVELRAGGDRSGSFANYPRGVVRLTG